MALSFGQTGLADHTDDHVPEDYLDCVTGPDLSIRVHLDAVDGIARDVVEGVKSLPKRGVEIGGLLLGSSVNGDHSQVSIERYQRLACEHRFGPQFALDQTELDGLGAAAAGLSEHEDLMVSGFYRSNTRADFQLEQSDLELADRYFPDPGDLALLIQPVTSREIRAQFFMRRESGAWERVGEEFLFRGRVVGPMDATDAVEPEIARVADAPVTEPRFSEIGAPGRVRRLVPDFLPAGESPPAANPVAPPAMMSSSPSPHSETDRKGLLQKWWPLACALALVGGALFLLMPSQSEKKETAPPPTQSESSASMRPLGLYVDPSADAWRISWNTNATALQRARNVALFVREGEDQNRIDLAPQDLQSGTYQYQPKPGGGSTRDVTFRIEVTDNAGHLSAESYRLVRSAPAAAIAPVPVPAARPVIAHPRALKKVAPLVPAGIRPRIHAPIPLDVRVSIDDRGRVTSAVLVTKSHNTLQSFLAGRAIAAAKQWKFEPQAGSEVIHFVFEH